MNIVSSVARVCLVLLLFSFSVNSQASVCMDIYTKVKAKGCTILEKVPEARKICDLANHGSEILCEWCSVHPGVCLAIAGAILYAPEQRSFLMTPMTKPG